MFLSTRRSRVVPALALASGLALIATGCSSDSGSSDKGGSGDSKGRILNVFAGSQTPIVANFNPYSATALHAASGPIYETLFYYNKAAAGDPTPLLGESYEFSADGTELTVKLKSGVKWSDGEAFSADDVVFTFNQAYATQDFISSIEAVDDATVKFVFTGPQFTSEYKLLGTSFIVPEHLWKDVADPATFTDEKPVGTGPYVVDSVSATAYTIVANPNYREQGKPAVKTVRYVGIDSNQSADSLMVTGKVDWASMFVPDPDRIIKDGRMSYLPLYSTATTIYTCSNAALGCAGPQTDVAVRQALNVALDRTAINTKAFSGVNGKATPTFTLPGRDDQWVAKGMPTESPQTANVAEAGKILEAAGYAKDADGIYAKGGQKVEMTLVSVDGWNDYNAAAKMITEQAQAAGIKINNSTVSQPEFSDQRQNGTFQLIVGGVSGTSIADPYQTYYDWFSTVSTAPVGETVPTGSWNFARYSNPEVDAAVLAASQTGDVDAKKAAYATVQEQIVNDLPYIPLVLSASQMFMDSQNFTGWPTEADLYAFPAPFAPFGAGVILSNLTYK